MGRGLFVPDQDMPQPLLLEDRVIDREHRAAGIAEHDVHAEIAQRLDQDIGSTFFGHDNVLLLRMRNMIADGRLYVHENYASTVNVVILLLFH